MLFQLGEKKPVISKSAFISETACIVGDVIVGERSSVWFNTVIRGDRGKIIIGDGSNIQDGVVVHCDASGVEIGTGVSIGHGAVIHGCRIKNNVIIGMNATVMNRAEIGDFSIVGAGALVPEGRKIAENSIVFGVPCKHARESTAEDREFIKNNSKTYEELALKYLKQR